MTDQLSAELEYSQQLVRPLLATLQGLSKRVAEAGGAAEPLRLLLSSVQLVASIFYSLNSPGLTEVGGWRWVCGGMGSKSRRKTEGRTSPACLVNRLTGIDSP